MFTNCDGVTVEGNLSVDYNLGNKNRWYFISLPYDMRVGDMNWIDTRASKAIRYYDGKNRAANGASGSWKNYGADDVIPAGTGFIMQVSESGWWSMPSVDNESKQYMTSYKMFVKQLEANPSEKTADNGWNLVGNPYQCWYNIHRLNFIAPITVNNGGSYLYTDKTDFSGTSLDLPGVGGLVPAGVADKMSTLLAENERITSLALPDATTLSAGITS